MELSSPPTSPRSSLPSPPSIYSPPPPVIQYSPRKRSRRRSKDKIRELHHVSPINPTNAMINEADLDLHAWGLGDLKKDIQQLSSIVGKCTQAMNGRSNAIPILGDQLQKWRAKRMKSQLIGSWNVTVSKILQGEYTFQIWLEAIQTKKRIIRVEALKRVEELEALVAFHEYRLDAIDDRMDECKVLAVSLKKQCNVLSAMKLFLEDQITRQPPGLETVEDEAEEVIFKGYSSDSGRAVSQSDVASARTELSHLSMSKFNSRPRRQSSFDREQPLDLETEIAEKLELSIDLVNRCNNLQEIIRQNQKKEMASLGITWRCRSMLRQLCEFSLTNTPRLPAELTNLNDESVLGSGIGDSTINRESRLERSGSDSEAEDPLQFTKSFRKITLKSSREMIGLMEVLTEQAAKSRGYLQKLSDFKQELSEIKIQLESYLPPNSKWELIGIHSSSLVSEIVLGYREIIPSELTTQLVEKHTPLSGQFPFIAGVFDTTEEEEKLALAAILMAVTDSSSAAGRSTCFVKELSLEELGDLSATLEASQLPINPLSQCELGSYLKQQGLPPPWVSPALGKIRSQSVDFDLPDTPFWSDASSSGCGLLIARGSLPGASSGGGGQEGEGEEEMLVGIDDIVAVFSTSFVYRNLFASIALRDHLEPLCRGRLLPLYVLDRVESVEASLVPLTPPRLSAVLKAFLEDNLATVPTFQRDWLPSPFSINLSHFPELTLGERLRLFSSLRCSHFPLSEVFVSEDPAENFFEGLTLAVNSWNPEAAKDIVLAATDFLLTNPQLSSHGDPFLTSWNQTRIMLAPLENLVTVVSGYDLCSNRQHRQSDLFVPLAAIRILLVAVNKQTYHRFCECCEQLSQWIHLSSIVTLQLFRSARISRPSSSSSLCGLQEDLSAMDPLLKYDLQVPPSPSDDPIPRRVPLAGNVTVSSRTELYHDLLALYASQLMPPPSPSPLRDLYPLRQSIHLFEQTLENTGRLVYALCSLVEGLAADSSSWSPPYLPFENLTLSRRQLAILFSIRSDIRLSILQYLLGLDERWSLEATIAACRFVKRCLEQSASVTLPLPLSFPASPFFRFSGQRRSKLYPSSSLGLLALALPRELSQRTCRVLYALGEDGIGIVTLKRLLHQEDLSQREPLPPQHLLLLIQDSYGHLFGAFLSLQKHQTDLLAPQLSFLFRALPDLRIFPLLQREGEEQLHLPRWFSSSGIHIGSNPAASASPTSFSYASSSVLFLDPSFSFGHTSAPDPLLSNERLSLGEEFTCKRFEVWAFSLAAAEQEHGERLDKEAHHRG